MAKAAEKKVNVKQCNLDLLLKEEVFKAIMAEDATKTTRYELIYEDNEAILITTIEQRLDIGKIKKANKPKKTKKEESKSLIESLTPNNPGKRKSVSSVAPGENKKSPKKQNVNQEQ